MLRALLWVRGRQAAPAACSNAVAPRSCHAKDALQVRCFALGDDAGRVASMRSPARIQPAPRTARYGQEWRAKTTSTNLLKSIATIRHPCPPLGCRGAGISSALPLPRSRFPSSAVFSFLWLIGKMEFYLCAITISTINGIGDLMMRSWGVGPRAGKPVSTQGNSRTRVAGAPPSPWRVSACCDHTTFARIKPVLESRPMIVILQ